MLITFFDKLRSECCYFSLMTVVRVVVFFVEKNNVIRNKLYSMNDKLKDDFLHY